MDRSATAGEVPSAWRTLFDQGALGLLTDSQLLDRFLSRDGHASDDAFSVLLDRHGPMVRAVCRRRLRDPHRADDAFQAVFVVLVRRASDASRRDQLGGWLHQVAVRVCRESIRQTSRERRLMDSLPPPPESASPPEPTADLLSALDEELSRLPDRYRTPIVLCDLEGLPRDRAALLLDIPEGTLSSRLSRGRSLLRDRLSRRGLSPSASPLLIPCPAPGPLPAPLVASTIQSASSTASTLVSSLVKGVLMTLLLSRLQSFAPAVAVLALASLAAGVAWSNSTGDPPLPAPPSITAAPLNDDTANPTTDPGFARGLVVDAADRPVPGAAVRVSYLAKGFTEEVRGTTDASGQFELPVPRLSGAVVVVTSGAPSQTPATDQVGFAECPYADEPNFGAPLRIVVREPRRVNVHVTDDASKPIPGATVEAVDSSTIASATTGDDGRATLSLPPEAYIDKIFAWKDGAGLDFRNMGKGRQRLQATELPDRIDLSLTGGRTVTVRVVDTSGQPMEGVTVWPGYFFKYEERTGYCQKLCTGAEEGGVLLVNRKTTSRPKWPRSTPPWISLQPCRSPGQRDRSETP